MFVFLDPEFCPRVIAGLQVRKERGQEREQEKHLPAPRNQPNIRS